MPLTSTHAPRITCLAFIAVFSVILPSMAHADMSDADYQAALRIAEKKVARTRSLNSQSSNALSSSLIRSMYGRYYQVGDNWDVVAWSYDNTMARMTSDPASLQMKGGRGGVFHYEVKSVKGGIKPEVVIEVTQREELGLRKPDAKVQRLTLTMNDQMTQSLKSYTMTDGQNGGTARDVRVPPVGMRSSATPLELFPLDVPELITAESKPAESLPALPEKLQSVAAQASYKPDLAKGLWFEQDDFFGRPIQAMWSQGDPWPAYYKTTHGVAILIRKGHV
jgi:hypothetical protein